MFALLLQQRNAICRKYSRTLLSTLLNRNSHLLANKGVNTDNVMGDGRSWERLRKILLLNLNRNDTLQTQSIIKVSQEMY